MLRSTTFANITTGYRSYTGSSGENIFITDIGMLINLLPKPRSD